MNQDLNRIKINLNRLKLVHSWLGLVDMVQDDFDLAQNCRHFASFATGIPFACHCCDLETNPAPRNSFFGLSLVLLEVELLCQMTLLIFCISFKASSTKSSIEYYLAQSSLNWSLRDCLAQFWLFCSTKKNCFPIYQLCVFNLVCCLKVQMTEPNKDLKHFLFVQTRNWYFSCYTIFSWMGFSIAGNWINNTSRNDGNNNINKNNNNNNGNINKKRLIVALIGSWLSISRQQQQDYLK